MSRLSNLIRSQKACRIIHEIVVHSKTIRQNTETRKEKGPSENQFCQNVSPGKVKNQNRSIDMQIKSCETSINHPIVREFPGNTLTCSWFILLLLQNVSHYLFLISTRESEHSGRKNVADDKVFTILRKHFWSPSRKLFGGTGGGRGEWKIERNEMRWKFNVRVKNLFIENHLAVKIINFE